MKKYFLSIPLITILIAVWTLPSMAQKRRYIKREHGVKFQGNVPINVNPLSVTADFQGAYAYNWKGFAEAGPYFKLSLNAVPSFSLNHWAVGLMGEYNFIKNRGRRKLIPSLGVQLGVLDENAVLHATGGAHASLKWFVAYRTAFITSLQYDLVTPAKSFFSSFGHKVDLSMGFSYYFDFY